MGCVDPCCQTGFLTAKVTSPPLISSAVKHHRKDTTTSPSICVCVHPCSVCFNVCWCTRTNTCERHVYVSPVFAACFCIVSRSPFPGAILKIVCIYILLCRLFPSVIHNFTGRRNLSEIETF